jgi:hypothetical protein
VLADARTDERDLLCAAWRLSLAHAARAFPPNLPLVHDLAIRTILAVMNFAQ